MMASSASSILRNIEKPDKSISFKKITADKNVAHGWIRKQTSKNFTLERLAKSILRYQWPKRIIVLRNGCLYVYKNEHDTKPCAAVSLYGFTKLEKLPEKGDRPYEKWGFTIEHTQEFDGSILRFAALSEQDRQGWLHKIKNEIDAVNNAGGRPLPPPPVPQRRSETAYDDDQPEETDAYWSIKQVLQSSGEVPDESKWPAQRAPPPPVPARTNSEPKCGRPSSNRSSGEMPASEDMGGIFGKAFHHSSNAERNLDPFSEDGVYIIRNHSDANGKRTLSVKCQGAIKKYSINYENNQYCLEMEKQLNRNNPLRFKTMDDLLQYYRITSLPSKANLDLKLWVPYSDHPKYKPAG